jgi:hypothetical protein
MNKNVITVIIVIVVVASCSIAMIYFPNIQVFMRGLMHGG